MHCRRNRSLLERHGMAVSWQRNPLTLGCFGYWSDDARRLHYSNLCAIDGRLVLAGEHLVSVGLAGGGNPVGA
jgi:monoamine oxidase